MDRRGTFIATLLDSSSTAYAANAVSRLMEADEEVARLARTWGFSQLVADSRVRLQNLAEALATGRPELFVMDVEWLNASYAARGVPVALLRASLACLRDELEENLPDDAVAMACSYLDEGSGAIVDDPAPPASFLEDGAPDVELARRFLHAILAGQRQVAERTLIEALEGGTSVTDLHGVITRCQAEMGRMWQVGEVHAAEEHLGSRIVEEVLVLVRSRMPLAAETGRSVLTAAVPGNLHDIGARIVADHFEMAGWKSLFLGADTPSEDFVRAVVDFDVDLVALSAGLGLNVRSTADLVAQIRAESKVPILVGGRPFVALPDLWKTVVADATARDAVEAVQAGERLIQG